MNERRYPDKLEIAPLRKPPNATVSVPGSKSITNRALVLASLAPMDVPLTLRGPARCDDTEVMIECLRRLGYLIEPNWDNDCIELPFDERRTIPSSAASLDVRDSGTTARFITAILGLACGRFQVDGSARMRQRPMRDLVDAMNQLDGVRVHAECGDDCLPIVVESHGWTGGVVRVRGDTSSQFLSALLLASPFANGLVRIELTSTLVSRPYVEMTLAMLRQWGCEIVRPDDRTFELPADPSVDDSPMTYFIEPDASAASYFLGAAAIDGGRVTVLDLKRNSVQGDARFADLLGDMGCRVEWCDSGITVHGRPLTGIDIDMNDISDCVPTLAAVACFAEGPTTIRNVAHIRHKESDRIAALATELRKIGAEVDEFPDGLRITPRPLHGAEIETYNDHRIAMSMALIGLKVPGIVIKNPGCVAKTYPGFWDDLEKLRS